MLSGTELLLIACASILIWAVVIYNRLVSQTQMKNEAWSGVDVQLKRRADLIPNLVDTVKRYMAHENTLLNTVTELRSLALNAGNETGERGKLESQLGEALQKIMVLVENYPELKATDSFQQLSSELVNTEDQIEMARRYYNGTVRNINISIEAFPSNLVANIFRFGKASFFNIDKAMERKAVTVQLDKD